MKRARGIVVARPEGLPHRFAVELTDGEEVGCKFVLVGNGKVGWEVEVSYHPDDQFAQIERVLS